MDKKELWILLKSRYKRMPLWSFFQIIKFLRSPQQRTQKIPTFNQRASFCICQTASYTVEAAIVIPILAGYLVTILFFFQILQIQCLVDEALFYAGRKVAVESSVVDTEALLFLSAQGYLLSALEKDSLIEKYVEHGAWGVSLWESTFDGNEIALKANYTVELPIQMFGLKQVQLTSQNKFRKWNRTSQVKETTNGVYVTPTGEAYHISLDCRVLQLSIKQTYLTSIGNLRGVNGQKYYECPRCNWKDDKEERVYYTDYGTLYHKDISCSSLKRTVEKIPIEEIGERRPCSFCY